MSGLMVGVLAVLGGIALVGLLLLGCLTFGLMVNHAFASSGADEPPSDMPPDLALLLAQLSTERQITTASQQAHQVMNHAQQIRARARGVNGNRYHGGRPGSSEREW